MIPSHSVPQTSEGLPLNIAETHPFEFTRRQEHSVCQLLRRFTEQHLNSHEHISLLAIESNEISLIIETKEYDSSAYGTLQRLIEDEFPGYSLTVRAIEFSALSSPDERSHYRNFYLSYPRVVRIDTVNKVIAVSTGHDLIDTHEQLLVDLRMLTGKQFTVAPLDFVGSCETSKHLAPSHLHRHRELQQIAGILWKECSFNNPFNSFSVDFGQSKIEVNSELEGESSPSHTRHLKSIEEKLHPHSVSLVDEFSLRELGVFLHDILPAETLGYKVIQEGKTIIVNLLLELELREQSDAISRLITDEIRKHYRSEVKVSVTLSTQELAEQFFCNEAEPVHIQNEAHLRQMIFGLMPTRYGLRTINRCPEKGLTELTVTSPPPSEIITQLEALTGGAVTIKTIKLPPPTEAVENPVRWLKKYGEPPPYFAAQNEEAITLLGHGGFLTVGGSSMLLNLFGRKILLDIGGYLDNNKRFALPKESINEAEVVIFSHAHFDHVGGSLEAVLQGLSVPILTTHSTAVAMYAVLEEQARIKGIPPSVIEEVYKKIRVIPFNQPIRLATNLTVTFYPAGHLLGAALTRFEFERDNGEVFSVLYTGDFKYGESRLHEKATVPPPSDIVISEGTYGTKDAPDRKTVEREFFAQIQDTVKRRGTTLLPVLTLNRAQEVLSVLDDNRPWFSKHRVPIHVVGSVIEKNQIYTYLSQANPTDFKSSILTTKPWRFNHHTAVSMPKKGWFSRALIDPTSPKVIVASGGMLLGQAERLLKFFSESEKNLLLLTCYQAETTLGREILNYAEGVGPKPQGYKKFRMRVSRSQFQGHSSGKETLDFLSKVVKPTGKIILVHGEKNSLLDLEDALRARGISKNVIAPKAQSVYDLLDGQK